MNEFEKRAVSMLSDEEREKIVGGATENDALSSEQCDNLRGAVNKFSNEKQIQITGKLTQKIPMEIAYGCPMPDHPLIFKKQNDDN